MGLQRGNFVSKLTRSAVGAGALMLSAMALAAEGPALDAPSTQAPAANICFGGLEDGKLIPHDGVVRNHFRETSVLGCTVDGGEPAIMPDLKPLIVNGKLA